MSRSGRCSCGAVSVTVADEPLTVRACWCHSCQTIAAGGATYNAFYRAEDVRWEGDIRWHDVVADSGAGLSRGFCPTCGTPVITQSHARRHLVGVRIGVFADTEALAPRALIWTGSAPSWACLDPVLPHSEGQPPPLA